MQEHEKQQWETLISLLKQAFFDNKESELLELLLTPDERAAFPIRLEIVKALLSGQVSQRQLKEQLGTGIATITRGSNSLKIASTDFKQWLVQQLFSPDESSKN